MKFRLVLPTLGTSRWWHETLASTQALHDADLVVVTPAKETPGAQNRTPRLVFDEGRGLYAAVNAGFAESGVWTVGSYLNDDDRFVSPGIQKACACLEADPKLGAVFGRVSLIWPNGRRLCEIPVARHSEDMGPLLAGGIVPLAQPGTVFRRELYDSLGGFDANWRAAGDMDFFMRAWQSGWRFAFINELVAEFRVHPGQISRNIELVAAEKRRLVLAARTTQDWTARLPRARLRFRLANLGVYWGRVRRYGFLSMEALGRMG